MKRTLASLLALLLAATSAVAQQTNDAAAARAVIERARARYRTLKTYQDRVSVRLEIVFAKGTNSEDAGRSSKQSGSLAFASPNRIALASDTLCVYCDGEHLRACLPRRNQYTEAVAPPAIHLLEVSTLPMFMMIQTHPVALMLTQPQADFAELFPAVHNLQGVAAESRNGEPGHRVSGTFGEDTGDPDRPVPLVSFWFSDATGLLREMRVDFTESYRRGLARSPRYDEENKPPKVEKAQVVLSLDDIVLDAPVSPERFVLVPDASSVKVDELSWGTGDDSRQLELIGHPAPDISGTSLDGQPVSLSALRGRVVLLDFWAMWCGPCVQAIPQVQAIAGQFTNKAVTVLGINRDPKGSEKQLKKFLDRKKITFRQFLDPGGDVSQKYKVNGIPCRVLIGTNGIIQAIEVGFRGEEDVGDQIEELLTGKTLFDTNEPTDGQAKRGEPVSSASTNAAASTRVEEINPNSLASSSSLEIQANSYGARKLDVDGDGKLELVIPDWQGGLRVFSADGLQTRRIHFQGKGGMGTQIKAFEPVREGKTLRWLVGFVKYVGNGMAHSSASVGLYSSEGETIWTYQPSLPETVSCEFTSVSAGDLRGDGKTELIAGMTVYNVRQREAHMWENLNSNGYLAIFDESGNCLSLRRVGQRIELVQVAPNSEPGKPSAILCLVDNNLRRFQWSATSSPPK